MDDVIERPDSSSSKEQSRSSLERLSISIQAAAEAAPTSYAGTKEVNTNGSSVVSDPSKHRDHAAQEQEPIGKRKSFEHLSKSNHISKSKRYFDLAIWLIQEQWLLIGMGFVILVASQAQVPRSQEHLKEVVVTYLTVSIIFFTTGCTLPTQVLLSNYSRWKIHFFVQIQSYLMTSAISFAIVSACASNKDFMDPWLLLGLIFGSVVPTTISSNVIMTRQAGGNTALTVVESTLGNFLSPFLSPVLVSMYTSSGAWYTKTLPPGTDNYQEIYRRVFKQLGLSLFLPMVVGQIVQNLFPEATKTVFTKWKFGKLSPVALLVLIWQTYDQAFGSSAFSSVKPSNIVFIVFISIALFILWLAICFGTAMLWLPRKDVIACCYCVPAKALTLLVPMSTVMYVNVSTEHISKMQIPIVIFQALQVAFGSILTMVFRNWIRTETEKEERDRKTLVEGREGSIKQKEKQHVDRDLA